MQQKEYIDLISALCTTAPICMEHNQNTFCIEPWDTEQRAVTKLIYSDYVLLNSKVSGSMP